METKNTLSKSDLDKEIAEIYKEAAKKRELAILKFYYANYSYREGDIFTDHIGAIRIEKIQITFRADGFLIFFLGTVLLKSGQPDKKNIKREAFLRNDISTKNK